MKLSELVVGQKVIVQIVWDRQNIEFTSDILGITDKGIYVTTYRHHNLPLDLEIDYNSKVTCNIFADSPKDSQRVSWRKVDLITLNRDGQKAYYVTTNNFNYLSNHEDRRSDERMYIHKDGKVLAVGTEQMIAVKVHDVSNSGISFYAPNSFQPTSNQVIVFLEDSVSGYPFSLKITCTVARMQNKGGLTFYGCRIAEDNKDYLLYSCLLRLKEKRINPEVNNQKSSY